MVDLVHFQHDRLDDVVDDQLEVLVAQPVRHVPLPAGEHVVHHDHLVASHHQTVYQMASDETRATRDENAHALTIRKNLHLGKNHLRRRLGKSLSLTSF